MLDGLGIGCLGFLTIIYPNRFWQWKWTRNELGSQNYMGACSQAPCATPGQRQMGIFYTWPYFSYWEVMQPNFLRRLVNYSYRLHNKFHFFFEVYLRSCIGLGLRAVLFTLISFHSLPHILTLHCADGGVGNSSSLSCAPSSAHVITFHSSKPSSIKVICPKHLVVFQGTSYYIF